jgi:hypothetical protein
MKCYESAVNKAENGAYLKKTNGVESGLPTGRDKSLPGTIKNKI